jgi:ActR/RegA family two-component response regulator
MRNKQILTLDDEQDITDTFKKSLEQQGFEVITYNDTELALSQFKENWGMRRRVQLGQAAERSFRHSLHDNRSTGRPEAITCIASGAQ